MQYREISKTGEKLPALGYGCMRLPTKGRGSNSSRIDIESAKEQLLYAIDKGVTYLDTAWPYHMFASESFLGTHILKDGIREKVNIATKLPCFMIKHKERIDEIFAKQLAKLNVEYFDYYLLHSLNGASFKQMLDLDIIGFMERIKKEGKVRNIGFSFHGQRTDFIRIVDSYDWDFTQVQFNILDENYQAGIDGIRYAASKGIGVIAMEPLRGGTLVDKIPAPVQDIYDEAKIKRKPADWALRWILDHPEITMVLSGMNSLEQIDENIATVETALPSSLTKEEEEIIVRVREEYNKLLTVPCSGCAYCLPCPAGIDIPSSLKDLNNAYMFSHNRARFSHLSLSGVQTVDGKAHWASSCTDCGKCEKLCPQHINIRDNLKRVDKELETPVIRAMAAMVRPFIGGRTEKS